MKKLLALFREYIQFMFFYEETRSKKDYEYQLNLFRAHRLKIWIQSCVTMGQLKTCENYADSNLQSLPNKIIYAIATVIEMQAQFIKHRNEYLPRLSRQLGLVYKDGIIWSEPDTIKVIPDIEFDVD